MREGELRPQEESESILDTPDKNSAGDTGGFYSEDEVTQISTDPEDLEKETEKENKKTEQQESAPEIAIGSYSKDEVFQADTQSEQAREREPKEIFGELLKKKKEVENELSGEDLTEERKKELLAEKEILAEQIVNQGCAVLKIDPEQKQQEIKKIEETEWEKGAVAFGFEKQTSYEEWQRNLFVQRDLPLKYYELAKDHLSEKQLKNLDKDGILSIGVWPSTIELTGEDIAMLVRAGVEFNSLKRKSFFSKKITDGKKEFDNFEKIKEIITQNKNEFLEEEVGKKIEQKKREVVESQIRPVVLEGEINRMAKLIAPSEKPDQAEKRELNFEDETRLKLLNDIRNEWNKIGKRNEKIREIDKMLEEVDEGDLKCTTKDGKKLKGKEAKTYMILFKQELFDKNEAPSTKIVKLASKLYGKDLMREAADSTGYMLNFGDAETQGKFREWVTNKVKEVYKENAIALEKISGKKLSIKKSKRNNKENEFSEIGKDWVLSRYGRKKKIKKQP